MGEGFPEALLARVDFVVFLDSFFFTIQCFDHSSSFLHYISYTLYPSGFDLGPTRGAAQITPNCSGDHAMLESKPRPQSCFHNSVSKSELPWLH